MARGGELGYHSHYKNGRSKWWLWKCSCNLICCLNIVVALFVLYFLHSSLSFYYPFTYFQNTSKYSVAQKRTMDESTRIRKALEPTELIRLVHLVEKDFRREDTLVEFPQHLKQTMRDEILMRLRSLNASGNWTAQREAVESWRMQKLNEAKEIVHGEGVNSSIPVEEAGVLIKGLGSNWPALSENIGLWIPVEITNTEHGDKPDGEEESEEEILPGRKLPPECHTELHTDYGGDAVRWGLTHHKESAYDCCMACLEQAKMAKPGEKRCNIWVYCPSETGCHSPDIYQHKNQECWLKYSERPKVNFKDKYSEAYRSRRPNAPLLVPWVSGVVTTV